MSNLDHLRVVERKSDKDWYMFYSTNTSLVYSFPYREDIGERQMFTLNKTWNEYIEKELEFVYEVSELSNSLLELSRLLPNNCGVGYTIWESNYFSEYKQLNPSDYDVLKPNDWTVKVKIEDEEPIDKEEKLDLVKVDSSSLPNSYMYQIRVYGLIGSLPTKYKLDTALELKANIEKKDKPFDIEIHKGHYLRIEDCENIDSFIKDPSSLIGQTLIVSQRSYWNMKMQIVDVSFKSFMNS